MTHGCTIQYKKLHAKWRGCSENILNDSWLHIQCMKLYALSTYGNVILVLFFAYQNSDISVGR